MQSIEKSCYSLNVVSDLFSTIKGLSSVFKMYNYYITTCQRPRIIIIPCKIVDSLSLYRRITCYPSQHRSWIIQFSIWWKPVEFQVHIFARSFWNLIRNIRYRKLNSEFIRKLLTSATARSPFLRKFVIAWYNRYTGCFGTAIQFYHVIEFIERYKFLVNTDIFDIHQPSGLLSFTADNTPIRYERLDRGCAST